MSHEGRYIKSKLAIPGQVSRIISVSSFCACRAGLRQYNLMMYSLILIVHTLMGHAKEFVRGGSLLQVFNVT